MSTINILNHTLVPEHIILPKEDIEKELERYNVTLIELPKILTRDPVVKSIGAKVGDVIKIIRNSPTAGEAIAYRLVIQG